MNWFDFVNWCEIGKQYVSELLYDAKETCSSAVTSFLGDVTYWIIAVQSRYSTSNIISEQYIILPVTANWLNYSTISEDASQLAGFGLLNLHRFNCFV